MSDGEIEDHSVRFEILDGRITMGIVPRERGDVKVRFTDEDGEAIWSQIYERGFWESRTKTGEIGNKLSEQSQFAEDEVKAELEQVWTQLTEETDDYEDQLLSPSVEQLIRNTESVEVYGGGPDDETEFHVYVKGRPLGGYADGAEADGGAETRKMVFTTSEWAKPNGEGAPPVVEKYTNAFYEVLDITWDQWREEIKDAWAQMQSTVSEEPLSTKDRIARSVVRQLRRKLDTHADADPITNDDWNAFYEEDTQFGDVVWVPGHTLDEALEAHDKSIEYRSALSRGLKSNGFTLGTSKTTSIRGQQMQLYPFLPDEVAVEDPELDVIGWGDDDDDDDGDEGRTDGDGGDGDGPSDSDSDGAGATDDEQAPSAEPDESPPDPAPESPESPDGQPASATPDERVEAVRDVVERLDPRGQGVKEAKLITEAAGEADIGPPDEIREVIEQGVIADVFYRPADDAVAVKPGGGQPPGGDGIPDEEGVPQP